MPTLLLVDDDNALRESLRDILEDVGWTVLDAANLAQAREMIANAVDIVVCDATLPDGSGLEWIQDVHQQHPTLRILLMTGLAPGDLPPLPPGITLLTKPVDLRTFLSTLQPKN